MIPVKSAILFLIVLIGFSACSTIQVENSYKPIVGFSKQANNQLEKFLIVTQNEVGRKIAVFDGDGTD
jgi:hypothetical protein